MHKVYQMPKSLYECVGTYECDCMLLIERPELAILLFGKSTKRTLKVLKNKSISWKILNCYGVRNIK